MKFGITYFAQSQQDETIAAAFHRSIESCVSAEQFGFSHFMIGEQHFTPYLLNPDCLQYFSYLSAKTKTIRFCPGISVLPHHHPIQFAERVAMLDIMSEGRIDIGVGRGYQRRAYDGLNINMEDSAERFDEYLQVVKHAFSPEPFSFAGNYYSTAEPIAVYPKPIQQPHPPIWVAGVSFHSLEKIGRQDHGFLKNPLDNLDVCKGQVETYKVARRAAGLPQSGDRIRMDRMTVVLDQASEAREIADQLMRRFQSLFSGAVAYKPPPGKSYEHYSSEQYRKDRNISGDYDFNHQESFSIFCDPKAAIERITYLRDAVGITELSFAVGMAGMSLDLQRRIMRTLAEKVIPHFA